MENKKENKCLLGGVNANWDKNQPEHSENALKEKDWYKTRIAEMVGRIDNEKYLKMIYGFVNRLHKE